MRAAWLSQGQGGYKYSRDNSAQEVKTRLRIVYISSGPDADRFDTVRNQQRMGGCVGREKLGAKCVWGLVDFEI